MTLKQITSGKIDIQALLNGDEDHLRMMVSAIVEATRSLNTAHLAEHKTEMRRRTEQAEAA